MTTRSVSPLFTDREHLTTAAYGTGDKLAARQGIYRYQQPRVDFSHWALDQVAWRGGERVLDAGCGNGAYLRRLPARGVAQVVGLDLSRGMLRENLSLNAALLAGDVQALPFADNAFDLVLAMHMLYHVPEIARAVRELRRVLRPSGVLLAATNGVAHNKAMSDLFEAALAEVAGHSLRYNKMSMRFTLEDGSTHLQPVFERVELRTVQSELLVPAPEPLLEYLESMRDMYERELPAGTEWEAVRQTVARRAAGVIAEQGVFRVTTLAGLFICS